MRLPRAAITAILTALSLTSTAAATPVVLDFDTLPAPLWEHYACDDLDQVTVSAGTMMIDSPSCSEWSLSGGEWHQKVDNAKGWAIEARVLVDPASEDNPGGNVVMLWINDHHNMLVVGLTRTEVRLSYPEHAGAPMDPTDGFHVIRIVSRHAEVRIYVDGTLRVDHTLSQTGGGTDALSFGDGDGAGYSRSYWDYLWYDVDCGAQCDPTGACVDGAPCDDGNACTQGDLCAKGICAGSPVSCPAIDACHEPGACVPGAGCTSPAKPDGSPCAGGVCVAGACTSSTGTSTGGSGGGGGAITEGPGITGRAGCYCEAGADRGGSPAWPWLAALLALRRRRAMRGR